MKTLPHWGNLLPLLGTTLAYYLGLGWLQANRATANLGECGHPRAATHTFNPDNHWWCPEHEAWFPHEVECPDCRDDWEGRWTLTDAEATRRDDEAESDAYWRAFDEAEAANREREDGWYLDLLLRSDHPSDPHSGWREGL